MSSRMKALAAALALSTPAPVNAAEPTDTQTTRQGFVVPAVISVAYRNPRITTNATEVHRQGGFATAGAVRWLAVSPGIAEVKTGTTKLGAL